MSGDHRDGEPIESAGGVELSHDSLRALARAVARELRKDLDELAEHRGLVLEAASTAKALLAELRAARESIEDASGDVARLVRRGDAMAEQIDRLLARVDAQTVQAAQQRHRVPVAAAGTAGIVALISEIVAQVVLRN